MFNKSFFKFLAGFLGIILLAIIAIAATGHFEMERRTIRVLTGQEK